MRHTTSTLWSVAEAAKSPTNVSIVMMWKQHVGAAAAAAAATATALYIKRVVPQPSCTQRICRRRCWQDRTALKVNSLQGYSGCSCLFHRSLLRSSGSTWMIPARSCLRCALAASVRDVYGLRAPLHMFKKTDTVSYTDCWTVRVCYTFASMPTFTFAKEVTYSPALVT